MNRFFLFLGSLVLFLLILLGIEGFTRVYYIQKEGRDSFRLRWMRLAGVKGVFEPEKGVINSLGFHSPEIPVKKEKGALRVLVVGGSAVYGWDTIESSWTWSLKERLEKRLPGKKIEVINAGVPGSSSIEQLRLLKNILPLDPDIVIDYGGWNEVYYSHYCPAEIEERTQNIMRFEKWEGGFTQEINRRLELNSLAFLSAKKNYYKFRKKIRGKLETNRTNKTAAKPTPSRRFGEGAKAPEDGKAVVHCRQDYVYQLRPTGPVNDDFSTRYERNLFAMYSTVTRRNVPFVVILQPDLAYSVSVKAVPPEARQILASATRDFYQDWLNASSQLYPRAQAVIKRLRGRGVLAYDFTNLFEGENAFLYTDSVHHKDPKALDMIAREVEEILVENELLPKGAAVPS